MLMYPSLKILLKLMGVVALVIAPMTLTPLLSPATCLVNLLDLGRREDSF